MKRQVAALAVVSAFAFTTGIANADADRFPQWASEHPFWMHLHPDRANLFTQHPDIAEKDRAEWAGWSEREPFKEWAEHHPGWVEKHQKQANWMAAHPVESQEYKYRCQWVEHRESKTEYAEWLKKHQWQKLAHR